MISDDELKALRQEPKPTPRWVDEPASAKQLGYIKGLVESREVPQIWLLRIKKLVEEGLTKGKAGEIIAALKKLSVAEGQDDRSINAPTVRDIPPGRYAVQTGEDANDLTYYRVKERQDNSGTKYKIMFVVAGPNEHYIGAITPRAKEAAKAIVRAGIGDSAALYGHTIGKCSICHTQITNRLSRELGIGPICGGRVYEDWDSRRTAARDSLLARGLDPNENVGD